jgi:hypothetical protein
MNTASQWSKSDVLDFFGNHLIALCVTFRYKSAKRGEHETGFQAYAGTILKIGESICFLTAGHILKGLQDVIDSSTVEIESAVLADTFGSRRINDYPIPFDLKSARAFFIDDEDEGLDFGVIVLDPYYIRLLAANGTTALEERNWINQSSVTFDAHVMFGLPDEFGSDRLSDSGNGTVSPTMFRVLQLESPPNDIKETRYPRFVGEIDRELPLTSLKGMSGGPIFGFKFGSETRYWIVALQSSWLPDRRITFGCPLPVLATLLKEKLGEKRDEKFGD